MKKLEGYLTVYELTQIFGLSTKEVHALLDECFPCLDWDNGLPVDEVNKIPRLYNEIGLEIVKLQALLFAFRDKGLWSEYLKSCVCTFFGISENMFPENWIKKGASNA